MYSRIVEDVNKYLSLCPSIISFYYSNLKKALEIPTSKILDSHISGMPWKLILLEGNKRLLRPVERSKVENIHSCIKWLGFGLYTERYISGSKTRC